ncbi:hypothetical protein [Paenibacillus sp. FSL L8-0506]|uniref:hypothetical protein n=1 Tax=Paenibacillus sp. FSL L8-0506 TaxID=2975335 RepID=UPI0030F62458
MTQRDWQKDMERVNIFEHAKTLCNNPFPPSIEYEPTEVALGYWLQEAKELQEIVSGRGRELLRLRSLLGGLNDELTVTEARADAAEKALGLMEGERDQYKMWQLDEEKRANDAEYREQKLKEAVQTVDELGNELEDELILEDILVKFKNILSTLYPDTPAPKEGSS